MQGVINNIKERLGRCFSTQMGAERYARRIFVALAEERIRECHRKNWQDELNEFVSDYVNNRKTACINP